MAGRSVGNEIGAAWGNGTRSAGIKNDREINRITRRIKRIVKDSIIFISNYGFTYKNKELFDPRPRVK